MKKIRIAFVKFGGLAAGGTERWLQMMAANLPREQFDVDYYYCDTAPYVGSNYKHADTDPSRLRYMQDHGVNLIKFVVGAKDITKPTHDWVDTDFWERFDSNKYDFVQTGKAGPAEYPYYLLSIPVIECVTLDAGIDSSQNLAWSFLLSQWQRRAWVRTGGNARKSSIVPIPVLPPATDKNLRKELNIPSDALVCGFHQRADNTIFSPIPLEAFARVTSYERYFIIMGGGELYRKQAAELGLKNIHFLEHSGDSTQISAFLNSLDIFAHGRCDGETFGTVLAEAMMHGLPCLSHSSLVGNNNAQPETMGPSGIFAHNVDEYTEMLNDLFKNEKLRKKLSAKAKIHAEQYYSLPVCVQKVGNTYKKLLGLSIENDTNLSALEYGFSPLGYLQAGDLENPASITSHILSDRIPEAFGVHMTRFFLPHIRTFIDIEANMGLYCLLAAKECPTGAQVHAFESQPEYCAALRHTIYLNNWEGRLAVHCLSLGKEAGEFTQHLPGNGFTFDNDFNDYAPVETVPAQKGTLDTQVASLGIKQVDFIKVDVEGFEQQVLEGATQTIDRDRPVLLIKIAGCARRPSYRNSNDDYGQTLRWLKRRGYHVWRCTGDNRLVTADPDQTQDYLVTYLCLHREMHAILGKAIKAWANAYRSLRYKEKAFLMVMKIAQEIRRPRTAARKVINKLTRLWMGIRFARRNRKVIQMVLAAYTHPQSFEHKIILRNWEKYYGIEKVASHTQAKADELNQEIWKAQCALFNSSAGMELGAFKIGFKDLRIYCSSASVLESQVFLRGFYDEITSLQLYQELVSKDSIVVDVGANVGVHTLALAVLVADSPTGRVIAYEPRASLARRLRDNLELNNLADRVTLREVGVWVDSGRIGFNEDVDNFNQGVGHYDANCAFTIEVVSLDKDLSQIKTKLSLIKIDVEGAELQIIQGARTILSTHRPYLIIEYNSPPWTLEQIQAAIPYPVQILRIPNTFYEQMRLIEKDTDLHGFNNLLLRPSQA